MRTLILKRIALHEDGTFGVLMENDLPFAVTLERKWDNNRSNTSCIPYGIFICKRYHSTKYPNTFEVTDVPNRTKILLHTGNVEENSRGCILVGEEFGLLNGEGAVLDSKKGFKEFLNKMEGVDEFALMITQ